MEIASTESNIELYKNMKKHFKMSSADFFTQHTILTKRLMLLVRRLCVTLRQENLANSNGFCKLAEWSRNVRKRTFRHVRQMKTQISLRISAVWSGCLLSAWSNLTPFCIQKAKNASSEDSDQTARMRSLIWIFAGRTCPQVHFRMVMADFISTITYFPNLPDIIHFRLIKIWY